MVWSANPRSPARSLMQIEPSSLNPSTKKPPKEAISAGGLD